MEEEDKEAQAVNTVRIVNCHYCGYNPPGLKPPKDGRCPKCHGFSWESIEIPQDACPLCS